MKQECTRLIYGLSLKYIKVCLRSKILLFRPYPSGLTLMPHSRTEPPGIHVLDTWVTLSFPITHGGQRWRFHGTGPPVAHQLTVSPQITFVIFIATLTLDRRWLDICAEAGWRRLIIQRLTLATSLKSVQPPPHSRVIVTWLQLRNYKDGRTWAAMLQPQRHGGWVTGFWTLQPPSNLLIHNYVNWAKTLTDWR